MPNSFSQRLELAKNIPAKVQEFLHSLNRREASELWDWLDAAGTDGGRLLQHFVERKII
jgi:predicted urease superfamily metal-dependent hydrolase